MTDEELQHQIEQGSSDNSEDAQAYQRVFNALKREPGFVLSPTFVNRVITRWEANQSKEIHDVFWFYAGIMGCVIAMIVTILMTNFKVSMSAFRFIYGYPGLVAFAILCILTIQWLDRKIVRKTT